MKKKKRYCVPLSFVVPYRQEIKHGKEADEHIQLLEQVVLTFT